MSIASASVKPGDTVALHVMALGVIREVKADGLLVVEVIGTPATSTKQPHEVVPYMMVPEEKSACSPSSS